MPALRAYSYILHSHKTKKRITSIITAAPLAPIIFLLSSHIIPDQQTIAPMTTAANQPKTIASFMIIPTIPPRLFPNLERGAAQYRQGSTSC
jgi:hypothetical protein